MGRAYLSFDPTFAATKGLAMKQFLLWMMLLISMPAYSAIEVYQFDTKQQEKLYQSMIEELRCLVCQNQNLSASNAALARDLRKQTHQLIMAGKSENDIVDYMTRRYGDFVLYRPPLSLKTGLLWAGPILLLLLGFCILYRSLKQTNTSDVVVFNGEKSSRSLGYSSDEER
jgi:cytochrome c-type biogenesis protein CcmH